MYRLHAIHRCGLLLQMSIVVWSVCMSLSVYVGTRVSCARMAEQIKMQFGGRLVGPANDVCNKGRGSFEGKCQPIVMYLPVHECVVHCLPAVAGECVCPVHEMETAFATVRGDKRRCGLLPNWTLVVTFVQHFCRVLQSTCLFVSLFMILKLRDSSVADFRL